ncbi:hypothetical protein E7744_03410 [Citricoccus sp. SGAir0253]|uniref:hypothetical protein n=1 Tax=Citricoccus sp. SGAir0253 TaxID=2567881 RepID=UPI0010CD474A|nr:hypothetical protein [Citricoccus sp. SGAir0253]QCU77368.1 hypothetical protein E7744_03410 [Citricoccus sp. SGAir0253]
MNPQTTSQPDAETQSRTSGQLMEAEMPALVRAAGWDSIGTLTETSCLGIADPEEASRETRWTASSGATGVSEDEAGHVAEQVRRAAEESGWTSKDGAGAHGDRLYGASKGDLTLALTYRTGAGASELTLALDSPCLQMPAGHTMTRSELDPMYGSSDPRYPHDDRSRFTNGTPRPLPSPSPSE